MTHKYLIVIGLLVFCAIFTKALKPVLYLASIVVLALLGLYLYNQPQIKKQVIGLANDAIKVTQEPFFASKKNQGLEAETLKSRPWGWRFSNKIGIKAKLFASKIANKIEDKIAGIVAYCLFISIPIALGWIFLKLK